MPEVCSSSMMCWQAIHQRAAGGQQVLRKGRTQLSFADDRQAGETAVMPRQRVAIERHFAPAGGNNACTRWHCAASRMISGVASMAAI